MSLKPQHLRARDQGVVEKCLPALLLFLAMEECKKIKLEFRADVSHHLNVASVSPMQALDMASVARLAKRVDDDATALLRGLHTDDPRDALYTIATFILLLVDEGRLQDKTNQAVLVSLMLIDDVKDDRPDEAGAEAIWTVKERHWREHAQGLIHRAVLLGLYCGAAPLVTI